MRTTRLIAILLLLESRGKIKARELAETLETSVRTVYRDIDILCQAGIPIYSTTGPNGGISFMDGYKINMNNLTGDDLSLEQFWTANANSFKALVIEQEKYKVKVRLSKFKAYVLEKFPVKQLEEREEWLFATIEMKNFEYAKIHSMDIVGQAEILEPEELREYVRNELDNTISRYYNLS